ncbi:hypothetical protein, partial [Yersinia pseudotuberculosis]
FNKSKGVFITDPKLKALLNPQPSWGFSGHKKKRPEKGPFVSQKPASRKMRVFVGSRQRD